MLKNYILPVSLRYFPQINCRSIHSVHKLGPHLFENDVFRRHICRQTRWPASLKKAALQAAINPRKPFPPATKSASSGDYHPKLSREYISAGAAYVSAAPFQFPRGSRPPLHEGKYLPETDTTCGKQYAPGAIQ